MGSRHRSGGRLAASLFVVCALGHAADGQDLVDLRFDWPDGLTLEVERNFEREGRQTDHRSSGSLTRSGGSWDRASSAANFVWTGYEAPDGYEIRFTDFKWIQKERQPSRRDVLSKLERRTRLLAAYLPTIVVDHTGEHMRVEGLDELRQRALRGYDRIRGLAEDPMANALLPMLTSDQYLAERALEDWNRMVEVWTGNELAIGERRVFEWETGGASGETVRNIFEYVVEERIPCVPGGGTDCVRLVVIQQPHEEDLELALRGMLGGAFFDMIDAPEGVEMSMENRFVTETEPSTLIPQLYRKQKSWSIAWKDSKGNDFEMGRTDRWTYRFTRIDAQ